MNIHASNPIPDSGSSCSSGSSGTTSSTISTNTTNSVGAPSTGLPPAPSTPLSTVATPPPPSNAMKKSIANFKSPRAQSPAPSFPSSSSSPSSSSNPEPLLVSFEDPQPTDQPYTEHLKKHCTKKNTRSSASSIYSVASTSKGHRALHKISSAASATSTLFKTSLFGSSSSSSSTKKQPTFNSTDGSLPVPQRSNSLKVKDSPNPLPTRAPMTMQKHDATMFRAPPPAPLAFQTLPQQQQQQQEDPSSSPSPVQYSSPNSQGSPFMSTVNVSTISDTLPTFITQQHRSRHPSISSTHSISPVTSHQSFSKLPLDPRAAAAAAAAATAAATTNGNSQGLPSIPASSPTIALRSHSEQYSQYTQASSPNSYPASHITSNPLPSPPFQSPEEPMEDQLQLIQLLQQQQQLEQKLQEQHQGPQVPSEPPCSHQTQHQRTSSMAPPQVLPPTPAAAAKTFPAPSQPLAFPAPNTSSLPPPPSSEFIETVIACFSFASDNAYSLALKPGDVIKVLLKFETGWWDGVNSQGQRGWFPSNYTLPLSDNQLQFLSDESQPLSGKQDVVLSFNDQKKGPTNKPFGESPSPAHHSSIPVPPVPQMVPLSSPRLNPGVMGVDPMAAAAPSMAQAPAGTTVPSTHRQDLDLQSFANLSFNSPSAAAPSATTTNTTTTPLVGLSSYSSPQHPTNLSPSLDPKLTVPLPLSTTHLIMDPIDPLSPLSISTAPPQQGYLMNSNHSGTMSTKSLSPGPHAQQAHFSHSNPQLQYQPGHAHTNSNGHPSMPLPGMYNPHVNSHAPTSSSPASGQLTPSFLNKRHNPVFNNVFESTPSTSEMSSAASSLRNGDGSRKGSVVSFMSSGSRNEDSELSFSDTLNLSEYKFIEGESLLRLSLSDTNPLLSEHRAFWNPYSNNQAKLFFYNPQLKLITNSLPFEAVSRQQATALAATPLPTSCPGPKDLTSVSEHPTISVGSMDNRDHASPLILKTSGDPYKELLQKYQKGYEYKNRTQSVSSEYSISSLSSSLSIPYKYTDNIEHLKTWSSIVGRLELIASNMLASLSNRDSNGILNAYDSFSNIIAHISFMSGIPPSTVPASIPSNREISRAYRRMVTCLSKLCLSADISRDKSEAFTEYIKKPRSSSVISTNSVGSLSQSSNSNFSGDRKFSIISELSESGEDADPYKLCARDTRMLLKCTKIFIKQFKHTLRTGSTSAGSNNSTTALPVSASTTDYAGSDFSADDTASLTSRGSIDSQASILYPVKKFRAGTWSNISISPTSSNLTPGMPRPPRRASVIPLEAYESIIPLDYEVVIVLEHQRAMVFSILRQIFSLINIKKPCDDCASPQSVSRPGTSCHAPINIPSLGTSASVSELKAAAATDNNHATSYLDMKEDRRVLFVSSLNSLVAIVTNISNLLESLDLSVYQKSHTEIKQAAGGCSNFYSQVSSTSNVQSLILLYDFLNVKQTVYDELLAFLAAVQSNEILEKDFIEHFAKTLEASKSSSINNAHSASSTSISSTEPSKSNNFSSTNHEISEGAKSCVNDNERIIKMRVMEMGVAVDAVVQTAALLAEERPTLPFSAAEGANGVTSEDMQDPTVYYRDTPTLPHGTPSQSSRSRSSSLTGGDGSISSYSMVATNSSMSKQSKSETPCFLKVDHSDELIFDNQKQVRGGTIVALVERLTQHDSRDAAFIDAFLLTFRSMMSPQQLFQMLMNRYTIQPPAGLTSDEFNTWTERKQKLIRFRVINILKRWLEDFWYEDPNSKQVQVLLQSMMNFTVELSHQNSPLYEQIRNQIEVKMRMDSAVYRRIVQNTPTTPPTPILPRNLKKIKLSDLDPLELARQLTLREFNLFEQITPFECLTRRQSKNKTRNNTLEGTPHIDEFIQNSNNLTNWVSAMILSYTEPKKRAQAIKYFTNVAEYCRQYNNFSSMMAIISALSSATIHRLKKTWVLVSEKTMAVLENMKGIMNSSRNFSEYRELVRLVKPPVIPFFGVCLTDLTFLEDANSDYLHDDTNVINFSKRMKSADIISKIMRYQIVHYAFQEVSEIQALLTAGYAQAEPIDSQYDLSLTLEPRVNTDERVTKLLEETGFL